MLVIPEKRLIAFLDLEPFMISYWGFTVVIYFLFGFKLLIF